MSRTIDAKVIGYDGERYGPHSATRWTIVYQEPGGSVIELTGQEATGPEWPDVIDIDREATVRRVGGNGKRKGNCVGILTDDGVLTWFVTAIPHLNPCPGDNGGGGGGGGTTPPGATVIPPIEGGGGLVGGGGGPPVSGGGGGEA